MLGNNSELIDQYLETNIINWYILENQTKQSY